MQSTNGTKRYVSAKMIASAARRREWVRRTLKAAMEAWTGPAGLLVLAFVASLVYVAFGGPFVASSAFDTETLVEALVKQQGDAGGTLRSETLSARSDKEQP